jgi:hypothetical protein
MSESARLRTPSTPNLEQAPGAPIGVTLRQFPGTPRRRIDDRYWQILLRKSVAGMVAA